jgi:hypothetical protein
LVVQLSSAQVMDTATFTLLDYAIFFVRFVSSKCFEFITVARVQSLPAVDNRSCLYGFITQVSLSGFRVLQVLKCISGHESSRIACSALVYKRRRGYEPAYTTQLTNGTVRTGRTLQRMKNHILPFEIYFDGTEGDFLDVDGDLYT